jgi:hypothetical protein
MSNCPLCNLDPGPAPLSDRGSPKTGLFRRAWRGVQCLFPAALLVLIPKCPLCIAADLALFAGVGVSVTTARWIQVLMVAACLASVLWLAFRHRRRRAGAR